MYERATTWAKTNVLVSEVLVATFFATLTALGAQIAVRLPFSPVPATLQVLMVIVAGLALGSRRGFTSMVAYLTAGALGLPVFAGGNGGLVYLFGPTGGYLLAFPVAAFVAGRVSERLKVGRQFGPLVAALAAVAVIYVGGSLWLAAWLKAASAQSPAAALVGAWHLGVLPFIGLDLVKAVLAVGAVRGSRSLVRGLGVEL